MTVPGQPVSKGRPQFTRKGFPYTPPKTKEAEERVGWLIREAQRRRPVWGVDGTHEYRLDALFALKGNPTNDLDNLLKLVLDACNGVVWADDRQVVEVRARMLRGSSSPRTELTFTQMIGQETLV